MQVSPEEITRLRRESALANLQREWERRMSPEAPMDGRPVSTGVAVVFAVILAALLAALAGAATMGGTRSSVLGTMTLLLVFVSVCPVLVKMSIPLARREQEVYSRFRARREAILRGEPDPVERPRRLPCP